MTEFDGCLHYMHRTSITDFLDMDVIHLIRSNPDQIQGSVLRGSIFYRKGYAEICE